MISTEALTPQSKIAVTDLNITGQEVSLPAVTTETGTRAKISRHILKAQTVNIETIKNLQSDLFSGEYELVTGQSKEALRDKFNLIVKDFRGLNLDFWEKKVVVACYCAIEKQNANKGTPYITIGSKADLYKEVLEKDKRGKYSGKERELFDHALERLKDKRHQLVFYKTVKDGKKVKRDYVVVEAPFITSVIIQHTAEGDTEQSIKDIKDKGRYAIHFHSVIFEGLVDSFRLIPKNVSREIKAVCTDITRTTELMEDFILWLHTHDPRKTEIRRIRETLIRELKLETLFKKNKKRCLENLRECYEIAKRTGYLTDYKIDQKGKECIVDVFTLNPDKFYHMQDRQEQGEPEAIEQV